MVLSTESLQLVRVWLQWEVVWLLAPLDWGWDSLKWKRVVVLNTEGMGL